MAYRYNPIPVDEPGKKYQNQFANTIAKPSAEANKSNMSSYFEPTYDAVPRPQVDLSQSASAQQKINNINAVTAYNAQNNSGNGGGNSGGNSGHANTVVVQSNPYESYYNKMISLYEKQLADERARQEQLKQERIAAANKVKEQRINTANTTYDTSMANLNSAKDSSLQQAYIKHMQEQKALPQQMQAYGINGGATETNLANMKNVYGQNRTSIMNEAMEQQRYIEQDRADAIAGAEADAAMAAVDAIGDATNYEASAVREYNDGLLNLYASALNAPTYTASTPTSNIKNSVWYEQATKMLGEGYTRPEIIANLDANGVSEDIIDAIMSSWDSSF